MELCLEVDKAVAETAAETVVNGLSLEGAVYANGRLSLTEDLRHALPPSRFVWRPRPASLPAASGGDSRLVLPLYRDQTRSSLVAEVLVYPRDSGAAAVAANVWAQRGVAVVMRSYV